MNEKTGIVLVLNSDNGKGFTTLKRSPILTATLDEEGLVLAVGTANAFSLLKNQIRKLWEITGLNGETQFRSAYFPAIAAEIWGFIKDEVFPPEPAVPDLIPDFDEKPFVAHADNFDNLKLFFNWNQLSNKIGEWIRVRINGRNQQAFVAKEMFAVEHGIVISPGSDNDLNGAQFAELHIKNGKAALGFVSTFSRLIHRITNTTPKLVGKQIEIID